MNDGNSLNTDLKWYQVLRSQPGKLLIALLGPLLVVGWHFVAMARQAAIQPHQREIIEELCDIRLPSGRPVPNHAGTKVIFCKYTKTNAWGWGINLHDTESRKTTFLSGGGDGASIIWGWRILGWSPDDRFFAYTRSGYTEVVICDGNTGAELSVKKSRQPVLTGTWLTSKDLLCSDGNVIDQIYKTSDDWLITSFSPLPADSEKELRTAAQGNPTKLFARDSNTEPGLIQFLSPFVNNAAVWQRSDALWIGEKGRIPRELWRGTNITLKEFSFSAKAGKFLLHCADKEGDFVAELYPGAEQNSSALKKDEERLAGTLSPPVMTEGGNLLTNVVRLDTSEYQPRQFTLINEGKGYLYINHNEVSLDRLVVKMNSSSPPMDIPWKAEIRGFEANETQLYLNASGTNEPAGIWRYDLVSGSTECLVSGMEITFRYSAIAPIIQGFVTNAAGERLTYYLLPPAVALGKKKYPMVVGIMGIREKGYVWDRYMQTVSSCGAYFVCMDRHKRDYSQWAEDALCAYEYLAKNYAVDTNKVYLMGVSAGAYSVNKVLEDKPELWKGAIYYNGGRFSNSPQLRGKTIFLDVGADDLGDKASQERFYQTQDALAAAGIRPILIARPGIGHLSASLAVEKDRLLKLGTFIQQP